MNDVDRDFVTGCEYLGGKVLRRKDKTICDFGDGKLGVISKPNEDLFAVVDNRMPSGQNTSEIRPVEFLSSVEGGIVAAGGKSFIRVNRDNKNLKVYTEIEGPNVYGSEPEKTRDSGTMYTPKPYIPKPEGCPTGSRSDPQTGECVSIKIKPGAASGKVPLPRYSSVHWNKNSFVPFILVDDDEAIAKAVIDTWVHTIGSASISREFSKCKKEMEIKLEVGLEYKKAQREGYVDKDVKIGNSVYDRDKLYKIAEEVFGVKILDDRGRPLRSELGKKMKLKGLMSEDPYHPIVIRGINRVYYLLNPKGEY